MTRYPCQAACLWEASQTIHTAQLLFDQQLLLALLFVGSLVALDSLGRATYNKDPISHEQACSIILKGRGTHFDPDVVDAFFDNEKQFQNFSNQREHLQETERSHCPVVAVAGTLLAR